MKKLLFILAGRFACRYARVLGWLPAVLAHIVRPSVRATASLHRLADLGLDDGDVFARTVIGAGGGRLYLLDHIEALGHLAKHGILSVEMVEGLNVVRDINYVRTDDYDRPVDDVRIIKATVVK